MRGTQKLIINNTIKVFLSVTLILMMVPMALFKEKAHAAVDPATGLSETADFGNFEYDANDASKNVKTFSEASILEKLGVKNETQASVQSKAEAEVLALLVKSGYSVKNNVLLAPNAGFKALTSKVSNITSKLDCLNVENVKDTTNWKFTSADPKEALKNGNVDINVAFANLVADYSIALTTNAPNKEVVLNLDSLGATGTVTLAPTGTKDSNNAPLFNLHADVKLKVHSNEMISYPVNVRVNTITISSSPSGNSDNNKGNNVSSQINDSIFVSNPTISNAVVDGDVEFSKEGGTLFKEGVNPEDYTFEAPTTTSNVKVSWDSETYSLKLFFLKHLDVSSTYTLKAVKDSEKYEFKISVPNIAVKKLGEFNLAQKIGNLEMYSSGEQKKIVSKKITEKSLEEGWKTSVGEKNIYLKATSPDSLWGDRYLSKGNYWDGDQCELNTNFIKVFVGDEVVASEDYQVSFPVNSNKLTINAPAACSSAYFTDTVSSCDLDKLDDTWFTKSPVSVSSGGAEIARWVDVKTEPEFKSSVDIAAIQSPAFPCKCLTKSTDGRMFKIDKTLKVQLENPTYEKYEIDKPGKEGSDWGIVDGLKNFINDISQVFFSKNEINVYLSVTPSISEIESVDVYDNVKESKHSLIGTATKVTDGKYSGKYKLTLSSDQEYDMSNWQVDIVDKARKNIESRNWFKLVPDDNEEYTKIVKDGNGPEVELKMYKTNSPSEIVEAKPDMQYFTDDLTAEIIVKDKYFKYSFNDSSKKDKIVLAVNYSLIDISTGQETPATQNFKYSNFTLVPDTDDCYSIKFNTSISSGSIGEFTITEGEIANDSGGVTDVLGRGVDSSKTWKVAVVKAAPQLISVDWSTPESENPGYYNFKREGVVKIKCYSPLFDKDCISIRRTIDSDLKHPEWFDFSPVDSTKNKHEYSCNLSFDPNVSEGKYELKILDKQGKAAHLKGFDDVKLSGQLEGTNSSFVLDITPPDIKTEWQSLNIENKDANNVEYYQSKQRKINLIADEKYSWADNLITPSKGQFADSDVGFDKKEWSPAQTNQYKNSITSTATSELDGHFEYEITGKDLAGNIAIFNGDKDTKKFESGKFVLDDWRPEVSIEFDKKTPNNRYNNIEYYNSKRYATITVKERNFNDQFTNTLCTLVDSNGNSSTFYDTKEGWNSSGNTHTKTIEFYSEGDYDFSVELKDWANNKSDPEKQTFKFTQDWTAPALNVTWDNNNNVNDKYYTAARTATIAVEEHNFNGGDIHVNPVVTPGNDGSMGSCSFSGWSDNGNTHYATVSFPSEGTYTMTIDGMDLATNVMTPYAQGEFILDWTQPQIQISGVENRQAYKEDATPGVSITDTNVSPSTTCNVQSLGSNKANPYNASPSVGASQATYSFANPEKVPNNDGVYRIEVNAVDMAGNQSNQSVVWSVNRFGSTYVIDADTETMMDGYVNDANKKDVVVTEINPSGIKESSVELTKGTFSEKLNEGTDYSVTSSGGGDSWAENVYKISKDKFKEDGHYTVNFNSVDTAGNTNDNTGEYSNKERNGKVNVKFMLDNAKPTCYFNDLSSSSYDDVEHKSSVVFEDNSKTFSEAKLEIDGEEKTISGDDLKNDKYIADFTLKEADHAQHIKISATDKAGNEMDVVEKSVVVSTNPFVRLVNNVPLLIGVCIGAVVIVGAAIAIGVIRRRKKLGL